jgi:protein SCO1/2
VKTALLLASLLGCLFGCARHEATTTSVEHGSTVAPSPAPVAMGRTSGQTSGDAGVPSIYELHVSLLDETGAVRSLDTFRGHPVLITMFYGSCPVACPLLTSDLKRLERQIPEPVRSDLRILMVSFDRERDTPPALARIEQERGLNGAHWTLASAADDEARELASVLGIKYRKLDNGAFFHSSVIVLLDTQGRPRAQIDGIAKDSSAILNALTAPSI